MTDPLIEALSDANDTSQSPNGLRYGTVTQVNPLMVRVGAASTPVQCRCLASFIPVVGRFVAVWISGADRLVMGEVSTTGGPFASVPWRTGPAFTATIGLQTAGVNTGNPSNPHDNKYNRYTVSAEGTVLWQVRFAFTTIPASDGHNLNIFTLPVNANWNTERHVGSGAFEKFAGTDSFWQLDVVLTSTHLSFWTTSPTRWVPFPDELIADHPWPISPGDCLSWSIQYEID